MQNLDVARLRPVGWLLVLLSLAAIGGVSWPLGRWVLDHVEPQTFRESRMLLVALFALPGIVAGLAVFVGGSRLLRRLGHEVIRPEEADGPDAAKIPGASAKPGDVRDWLRPD